MSGYSARGNQRLLRVVHIHRQAQPGAFSIEILFKTIASELLNHVELIEYEVGPRKHILQDIFKLRSLKADIYHVTGDVNYLIPLLPNGRTVLTVHDIGHYLYGLRGFKRWLYKWLWLIWPMKAATAVTTVSEATQTFIGQHLPIPVQKLQTIHNCYSPRFSHIPKKFNAHRPVILQVGTRSYKNVPRLVQALSGIPCHLVLVGKLDESINAQLQISKVSHESRTNLSDEQVLQAYQECDLVSFVSIGEGFGVPIIEAQATGRALVTANAPPMSDVAGQGACLASPYDVQDIRTAILKLIHESEYRDQVIQSGLENAKRYSPANIAQKYLDLYQRLVQP